jgi:nifR3 family TIM-barrel protein
VIQSPLALDGRLVALGVVTPVALAPMAGITDLPMRELVQSFGAGLTVSEMVASREMVEEKRSVRDRAIIGSDPRSTSVQIAGRDPVWMAAAARLLADQGAERIDINMGCPAKKVTGGLSGSALLRDHDHALRLIEAVVGAVDVPVTLKTRLGWDDDHRDTAALARRAEAAGIRMLTIHGRTRCQFYQGRADWTAIGEIVDAVAIPVLANGDITSTAEARKALAQSGAAGVMIGRGIRGRPWACAAIACDLVGGTPFAPPEGAAFVAMVVEHHEAMRVFYGAEMGTRVARKHLGWYMERVGTPPAMRRRVLTAGTDQVADLLPEALSVGGRRLAA